MEITIEPNSDTLNVGFNALLNEEYLRLSTNTIRNLYGYKPCMKWTMVGEVTNISYHPINHQEKTKSVFSDMFKYLDELDHSLSKINDSSNNIIKVAPIAVYIEHEKTTIE
jgi:hypothetical protein